MRTQTKSMMERPTIYVVRDLLMDECTDNRLHCHIELWSTNELAQARKRQIAEQNAREHDFPLAKCLAAIDVEPIHVCTTGAHGE